MNLGITRKKALDPSKTVKLDGLKHKLRFAEIVEAAMGFQPHELVKFKCGNKEFKLIAIFDSKDWNASGDREGIFEIVEIPKG